MTRLRALVLSGLLVLAAFATMAPHYTTFGGRVWDDARISSDPNGVLTVREGKANPFQGERQGQSRKSTVDVTHRHKAVGFSLPFFDTPLEIGPISKMVVDIETDGQRKARLYEKQIELVHSECRHSSTANPQSVWVDATNMAMRPLLNKSRGNRTNPERTMHT